MGSHWPKQRLENVRLTGDPWRTRISADEMQRGDNRAASIRCAEGDKIFDGLARRFSSWRSNPSSDDGGGAGADVPGSAFSAADERIQSTAGRRRDGSRSRRRASGGRFDGSKTGAEMNGRRG